MLEHTTSSTNTGRHSRGRFEGITETLRLLDEAITRLRRAGAVTNLYEISTLELVRTYLTERLFGVRLGPVDTPETQKKSWASAGNNATSAQDRTTLSSPEQHGYVHLDTD